MAVKSAVNERIAAFSLPVKKRKKKKLSKDKRNFFTIKALNNELVAR